MLQGLSLDALANEIQEQAQLKQDFAVESQQIQMTPQGDRLLVPKLGLDLLVNDMAHRQMGASMKIHRKYYLQMLHNAPDLLATNVNYWLQRQGQRTHVLRTMEGTARAFLGGGYGIVDHEHLLLPLLLKLRELDDDLEVLSTGLTENRLFLKLAFPKLEGEIRKGDVIRSGVTICNSETGLGGLNTFQANFRLVCTNGMTRMERGMRFSIRHSGQRHELGEILDPDVAAEKVERFLEHFNEARDEAAFQTTLEQMRRATQQSVEVSADVLLENARQHFGLTLDEQKNALENILMEEDLTQYGLMNAFTATAKQVHSYARASELEAMGSKILNLSPHNWRELATAQ
ncbi:DUF932 domain-containing protein [Acaryochloris sp. CCMEE 5410]|uniref:DUF932 domain-containing protein n=1 Tax=Acaryochloris sp. CCMEE 5410 TaxID=310037 RepID=UPI0002485046|nr:DUF932 domain-containing protein [Acaryochloris sp. CCMEE 5410]